MATSIIKKNVWADTVSNSYDIETRGNYVQYATSNSSSNSFVTASGEHLYGLFSYASTGSGSAGYQIAIGTNNEMWFRFYQWWGTAKWQNWERVDTAYYVGEEISWNSGSSIKNN